MSYQRQSIVAALAIVVSLTLLPAGASAQPAARAGDQYIVVLRAGAADVRDAEIARLGGRAGGRARREGGGGHDARRRGADESLMATRQRLTGTC
jgi:hypothetical protein